MKQSWQQKKIGADLIAASLDLKQAKRLGAIPGNLAQGLSAELQAQARRKVKHLSDLAIKYTPGIAKDEAPTADWGIFDCLGITREEIPAILAGLPGVTEREMRDALADPNAAYKLLAKFATERAAK